MKLRHLLLPSICVLSLGTLSAFADEPSGKVLHAAWEEVLGRVDLNKNGNIEVEEFAARLQQLAQQTDGDHNGKISPDELRQAAIQVRHTVGERVRTAARELESRKVSIAALEQGVHEALAQSDTDHNGELTGGEVRRALRRAAESASQHIAARCEQHRATIESAIHQRRTEHRQALHAVVEQIENIRPEDVAVHAAIQQLDANQDQLLQRAELQDRSQLIFSLADANHDGALTDDEIKQAAEAAAKRVRERIEQRLASLFKQIAGR